MGCIAAGADENRLNAASRYAYLIGTAFQIKDDLLDVQGDEAVLGKPVGSDKENDKTTYVSLVGIERAQKDVEKLTQKAIEVLDEFEDNSFMKALSEYLINREC